MSMSRPTTTPWRLPLVAGSAGAFALVAGLRAAGGAPQRAADGLPSASLLTHWLLPLARLGIDVTSIATVGLLLAAAVLLPNAEGSLKGSAFRGVRLATRAAGAWALCTAMLFWLTSADINAVSLPRALDPAVLRGFLQAVPQGRALLVELVVATAVALAARWTTSAGWALGLLLVAVVGITPPLLTGHSAEAGSHMVAVSSLVVHVIAASLWTGGLGALLWIWRRTAVRRGATSPSNALLVAVPRFSTLALWCVVALTVSGTVNAAIRLGSVAALLGSGYGALVLLKTAALLVLAGIGARHRALTMPALLQQGAAAAFARLAAVEVAIMSATIGLAVAMSRTPTPVPTQVDNYEFSRVRLVTGADAPPRPSVSGYLLQHRVDGFFLTGVVLAASLYAAGVLAMRRRGDRWPVGRAVAWYAGLLVVLYASCGGLAAYAQVLFSAHMIEHMVLSMLAPILLVLGAPTTLALRTLPKGATPQDLGPRQALLGLLHSRVVSAVTHPVVAGAIFVASLYGLYFTSLINVLMRYHLGHTLMAAHFLLSGCLFFYVLVGVDPAPRQVPHLARVIGLFVVLPFHAFFSVAIMSTSTLLAGSYYRSLGGPYGVDPLADQHLGGGLGWAMGEVPMVLVLAVIFLSWVRADDREARRSDRAADRAVAVGDDDELARYNARLKALNERAQRL